MNAIQQQEQIQEDIQTFLSDIGMLDSWEAEFLKKAAEHFEIEHTLSQDELIKLSDIENKLTCQRMINQSHG